MGTCPRCGESTSIWNRGLFSGLCPACVQAGRDEQVRREREVEARRVAEEEERWKREREAQLAAEKERLRQRAQPGLSCPRCGGGMEEGFLRDLTYGGCVPSYWVEGKPESSFWTGTKFTDKRKGRVAAYRCIECGHLELIATEMEE